MKYFVFLLLFSQGLFAQTITFLPKDVRVLRPGDITWVYAQSNETIDWKSLQNESIGDLYYVLDYKTVDNGVLLEIITKEPPQVDPKDPKPPTPDKIKVLLSGLEVDLNGAKSAQEIVNVDLDIDYGKNWGSIIIFLIGISALFLIIVGLIVYGKRTKKMKEFKQGQSTFYQLIKNAKTRKEIENVAMSRKKIIEYFEVEDVDWKRFQDRLDAVQFKEHWSTEELNIAQKALSELNNNLREKVWNSKA